MLADYGIETLEAAAAAHGADLGFEIPRPIPVDILRGSREVASMTTLSEQEIEPLPVDLNAALRVRAPPWRHRDPFDRLLIAHALESALTIATRDRAFERYGVTVLPG